MYYSRANNFKSIPNQWNSCWYSCYLLKCINTRAEKIFEDLCEMILCNVKVLGSCFSQRGETAIYTLYADSHNEKKSQPETANSPLFCRNCLLSSNFNVIKKGGKKSQTAVGGGNRSSVGLRPEGTIYSELRWIWFMCCVGKINITAAPIYLLLHSSIAPLSSKTPRWFNCTWGNNQDHLRQTTTPQLRTTPTDRLILIRAASYLVANPCSAWLRSSIVNFMVL